MSRARKMFTEAMRTAAAAHGGSGGWSDATRLVREGRLMDATARIQERLGAGLPGMPPMSGTTMPMSGMSRSGAGSAHGAGAGSSDRAAGTVTRGAASAGGDRRAYRLFVPPGLASGAPLVVMLHGGTQDADGFAACTGMDEAAARAGVAVVYPEQSRQANAMGYWNWFRPGDQTRDGGEPAVIAAITRTVAGELRADPARVAVAGFSAGAAMAAVMAATHPDVFCGAGVHSGLPHRAARDIGSAFAAMSSPPAEVADAGPVPLVVVHGDADRTVAPGNADAVVRSALRRAGRVERDRASGQADGGRRWTRERCAEPGGRVLAESWTVHGLGHAWSGGRAGVAYADPSGPDAAAAMLAFFGFTADRDVV
ncbi:alpha/beta hydrolase family esterase [Actinomycetospora straminea]|uniref:Poly(Hydroxyalkanoate) depolymerase family esterase n=1 Tax=Actinomycetospora straminea TaxID=663607 RepID=A0ABP9DTN0_9PSEU|nr:PHB depolymerase family esterase [Actinomycetospora straminea]MDD7935902.1 PHB depolymerase family esterase [Actinomycetospora straminea]